MFNFQGRHHKTKNIWRYRLVIVLLLIVSFFMAKGVWDLAKKNKISRDNFQEAASKLNDLEMERSNLSATVGILKTDRGVEAEVRKNFSVVKEGEKVINIIEPDVISDENQTKNVGNSWWSKFLSIF